MTEEELLIEREQYLANGVHIGTRSQHIDMDKYIFRVKDNQLAILNLEDTDKQIREAAELLAGFKPSEVLAAGRKPEARRGLELLAEATNINTKIGRFMPGTLTNPQSDDFMEPEAVFVVDPEEDSQVIKEAAQTNTTVISIADSGDELDDIDLAIPANNKSEKSIGVVSFLLAREITGARGEDFDYELEDFLPEETEDEEDEE
ncbi:30S ribosomal protein S2 [Candidatus Nanohalococcus occultus]|uniref:Ribosomal protein S2 n=1 Tax=Candidatus Nanohalococcus occultus TaxID=2978047 RepID=A0ABY8CIX8_9ARCH|nr:Ribosomal protein S2 [Candidatus Nanohaloarchaeota archaeon SVXNc]